MIKSFADSDTEDLFRGKSPRRFGASVRLRMMDKLQMLNAAERLNDMRSPPGNRLEALGGDRSGFYSVRINDQWRLCFRWQDDSAYDVEIVDYH